MLNIVIAGLGLHARHYHYKILEKFKERYDINILGIVDLESQRKSIEDYLNSRENRPKYKVYIPDEHRNMRELPSEIEARLNEIHKLEHIDGLVISTEPKVHKPYLLWAIEKDIDIMLDKPITASVIDNYCIKSSKTIFNDYIEIKDRLNESSSRINVLTHRRYNDAYKYIYSYLHDFIEEFQVPITYMSLYHSEGMWNMPDEFFTRENHPYKYGYGVLLHSGYHFIDQYIRFIKLNNLIDEIKIDSVKMSSNHVTPYDFLNQFNLKSYKKFFGEVGFADIFEKNNIEKLKNFGELDAFISTQVYSGDKLITSGNIDLLHTSYSSRNWIKLPDDTYKNNGRTKGEMINIQVGNLLNIRGIMESKGSNNNLGDFRIHIHRNNELVGGKQYEEVRFKSKCKYMISNTIHDLTIGGKSRYEGYTEWLDKRDEFTSDIKSHQEGVLFLSKVYESIARKNNDLTSEIEFKI